MQAEMENRIRETGMRLYSLMEEESGSVFRKEYWTGKLFEWCMHHEPFKVELFRFVDVFPSLKRPDSVMRHLREYFSDPEIDFPSALDRGLKFISPSWMGSRIIAKSIARNIEKIAAQFIVGETPGRSLQVLETLRAGGVACTIDLLGETVVSEEEAAAYQDRYAGLIELLDHAQSHWKPLGNVSGQLDWGHSPKVNISLKTSAMYSQMNPCAFGHSIRKAKERLRPILHKAIHAGAFVCFDMEHYAFKNLTLALYRSLLEEPEFREYPHTGFVIQSYLRDSERDIRQMIEWAKAGGFQFTIRLVKGAYWDQEVIHARNMNWPEPVFTNKAETDAQFERLAGLILQSGPRVRLACASHNVRSIATVMETAKELDLPDDALEYQVLYGMGEPVRAALRKAGMHVRVYSPIGEMLQGMSYLVRRLLENTANESFLRLSFTEKIPKGQLLGNPARGLEGAIPGERTVRGAPPPKPGPFRVEPRFDWSREEHREKFADALRRVRETFPVRVSMQIGGENLSAGNDFQSLNPNRPSEIVGLVGAAGIGEAELAVQAAVSAFDGWRGTSPEDRAGYLFRAASAARKRRYDLAAVQVFEVGKTWSEADADVCEAIDHMEYYGREMLRYGRPLRMDRVPGEMSVLLYEPRGVAVVIAPWNFPLAISAGMCSAAVVTGNPVVYKPASQSPVIGRVLADIFQEAGLPEGVFNFLPGPGKELGDCLTAHADVALIAFTGSREVGGRIIERAARIVPGAVSIKNVIVEMGGKNAIIVDSDADLDEAIVYILHSAFGYQGQKCSACSRLIVLEENYDRLVERLKAAAWSINIGPVEYPENFMGAVIDPVAREKILEYIEIGKRDADVLVERRVSIENTDSAPMVIFTGVDPESRLARDEIFGPVLAIIRVKDFDEALRVANGTQYALTGGVLTRDPGNITKARRNFRVGNLYINRECTGAVVGRHPFGGFKMSGLGSKAGGPDYLLHFMLSRNIVENTVRRGFAPQEADGNGGGRNSPG